MIITVERTGVSQLLETHARAAPPHQVYAYACICLNWLMVMARPLTAIQS